MMQHGQNHTFWQASSIEQTRAHRGMSHVPSSRFRLLQCEPIGIGLPTGFPAEPYERDSRIRILQSVHKALDAILGPAHQCNQFVGALLVHPEALQDLLRSVETVVVFTGFFIRQMRNTVGQMR
jgi:hypothetical protein